MNPVRITISRSASICPPAMRPGETSTPAATYHLRAVFTANRFCAGVGVFGGNGA